MFLAQLADPREDGRCFGTFIRAGEELGYHWPAKGGVIAAGCGGGAIEIIDLDALEDALGEVADLLAGAVVDLKAV